MATEISDKIGIRYAFENNAPCIGGTASKRTFLESFQFYVSNRVTYVYNKQSTRNILHVSLAYVIQL